MEMVVYDSVLFGVGHQVRRWADRVERRFTAAAIEAAPLNKRANKGRGAPPVGSLKAGISGSVTRVGPRHLVTDISSAAPYSLYVISGTGPITAGNPQNWRTWMYVPPNPGFGTRTRHQIVSGQAPNNFLLTAAHVTAVRHSSLRGWTANAFREW
jgi:hypothetical protein